MKVNDKLNMTMLCDFYELTMGNGYFEKGYKDRITYFDLFYRRCPDGGGFAIAAGLEQIVEYIQELHFSEEDIAYLRSRNMFSDAYLNYLANFKFTGDIWAVPEGTPVFPKEPILTVRAPAIEAQLIETYLLLCVNHQSLIATKANRIVRAAEGRAVLEFGSRRAQGPDAAMLGARAAYIGGCHGTACTIADQLFHVKASGTMAHAWVQMFDTEYDAFKAYCEMYPHNATLLVDTYDTLKSGVPNAIKAFNEVLKPLGITQCGIRLDSGDMAYLTQKARKMLDDAGWTDCRISVSNSLDEHIIRDVLRQGAKIDLFGVGERLITARSEPVFGGVYKLVAVEDQEGEIKPKIKISENVGKITTPHSTATIPARPLPTICASTMKPWTTARIWRSSIPMPPGRPRPSMTSPPRNCRYPFSKTVSWCTSCPLWRRSVLTAPPRWIPFGTKSSALTIPTPTMWT